MTEKRHNKKAPKSKVCDKKVEPKWYYTHVDRKKTGGHTMTYDDPEDHKKYYHEELHSSCSYKVTEADDDAKEINHNLNVGELRHYVAGGMSQHSDSHMDVNSEGTLRHEAAKDIGQATGGNYYRGTAEQEIKIAKQKAHHGGEGSDSLSCRGVPGSDRMRVGGDYFKHIEGDIVCMGEKNNVLVTKKDYAMNVGQNWDNYIKEKGKIETGGILKFISGEKLQANSKQDTTITSDQKIALTGKNEISLTDDTKIVLKVGSSTITIESGSIIIKSPSIEFQQG